MSRMRKVRTFGPMVVAVLGACADASGGTGGINGSDGGPIPLDRLVRASATERCRLLYSCPPGNDYSNAFIGWFGGPSACVELLSQVPDAPLTTQILRARNGLVNYHDDLAGSCLASLTCLDQYIPENPWFGPGGPCDSAFDGDAAEGEACIVDDDCRGGDLFCETERFAQCPGICTKKVPVGAACHPFSDSICAAPGGAERALCWADESGGAWKCLEVRLNHAEEGEPCQYGSGQGTLRPRSDLDANTLDYVVCNDGLACVYEEGIGKTCRATVGVGSPCSETTQCGVGVACKGGLCVAVPAWAGLGDACGEVMCEPGLMCEDDTPDEDGPRRGHCMAIGDGTQGSSCDNDAPNCHAGLVCARESNDELCVTPRATGEACFADGECASGLCASQACAAAFACPAR